MTAHSPFNRLSMPIMSARTGASLSSLVRVGIALLFALISIPTTQAQQTSKASSDEVTLELGFRGEAKVGSWMPFLVTTPDSMDPKRFEFKVLDGDDTPIAYSGKLTPIGTDLNQHQGWVKLGRAYGSVQLKLTDAQESVIYESDFNLSGANSIGKIYKSTTRMVLTFESKQKIAKAIEATTSIVAGENNDVIINLNSPIQLPVNGFGYQGVDTVFLTTLDASRLEDVTERQWSALESWIRNGGRLIFSAAKNGERLLSSDGVLHRFCPGKYVGPGQMPDSKRLEAFADNGQLIARGETPLPISKIENAEGAILLAQDDQSLIVHSAFDFGEIVFIAFDLDSERIEDWAGYSNLIHRLEGREAAQDSSQQQINDPRGSSVSHYGYDDLIGQLRLPLDQFAKVRFIAFTWIAVLIGLYILCIGPGDYFFLRKFVGKMELTWITFPLLSLLFCGLAFYISQSSRPKTTQVNQLEIIDIDSISKNARGTMWGNLYSPNAGYCDISIDDANSLGVELESKLMSWQGLPGDGLGGMQTKVAPGIAKPGYQQTIEISDSGNLQASLTNMPLYVSSTKALFGQWNGKYPKNIRSNLKLISTQLEGTVTNPFDVPLDNVRVLFENYAYVLKKQRLEPGETIDLISEMKERTTRSLLTRRSKRKSKDNKSHNSPWDPTEKNLNRIAEMLMFYRLAGGNNYTGLTHSYQNYIDMSGQIDLNRAILVGQLESIGTQIQINGEPVNDQYDQTNTVVRVVLPVKYMRKQRR